MTLVRRAHWVFAVLSMILGGGHIALAAPSYDALTVDALWFVGAGLGIVAVAMINIVALRDQGRASFLLVLAANAVMLCYFAAAWTVLKIPPVVAGLVLFAGLSLFSLSQTLQRSHARG